MSSAVFTIVKNEEILLPIWLSYYRRFFENKDIYILDHQTTDGSTSDLECNCILLEYDVSHDYEWTSKQVTMFAKKLFDKGYDNVLFADVDEIICPHPLKYKSLKDYIDNNKHQVVRVDTYQVVQDLKTDKEIDLSKPILSQRKWHLETHPDWNKSSLIKEPVNWSLGCHYCDKEAYHDHDLYLIHLHYMDFNICRSRALTKTIGYRLKDTGHRNCFTDKNYIAKQFKIGFGEKPVELVEIPSYFRELI